MWIIIFGIVFAVALYFMVLKPHKYWDKKGVPYVKPVPLVGNFGNHLIRKSAFPYVVQDMYSAYPEKRYVGLYQFLFPFLLIRDPELIKKIAVKEFDTFPEHRAFGDDDMDSLWSRNLFAIRGADKWHNMRATLSPSFTSSKMRAMYGLMKECAEQFTKHFENKGGTVTLEMKDAFTRFTNDVIATTAFGITCDSLKNPENEFYLMGKDVSNFSGIRSLKFLALALCPTLMKLLGIGVFSKKASNFFRGLIKETLKVREANRVIRPDMIHLLMEARKGRLKQDDVGVADSGFAVVQEFEVGSPQKRQKVQITDDDIAAQALIFFLAGFDTASTLMCFTAYELAINPDVQEKLFEEINQALQDSKGEMTYETLLGMKYLDMVVTEGLRKWPPSVVIDRVSVKPFTIQPEHLGEEPIELEIGTNCWIPIYPIHRDPKYYPNPEKFDPERFSDENKHNIKPFTYLPFGVGPRNCIGSRFALLESKLVITEVLRKFEIVPVAKTQIPLTLSATNAAPAPDGGFWLGLKPRAVTC